MREAVNHLVCTSALTGEDLTCAFPDEGSERGAVSQLGSAAFGLLLRSLVHGKRRLLPEGFLGPGLAPVFEERTLS